MVAGGATFERAENMLSREILEQLSEYVDRRAALHDIVCEPVSFSRAFRGGSSARKEMTEFIENNRKPSFNMLLFNLIDRQGISDAGIYKKAGIDRRLFSKIRSNPDYHPGKNTAVALALALELSRKEADRLIGAAGYSLSDCETFDLVIAFCIEHKIYDINDVNIALDYFSLKPLPGALE